VSSKSRDPTLLAMRERRVVTGWSVNKQILKHVFKDITKRSAEQRSGLMKAYVAIRLRRTAMRLSAMLLIVLLYCS
jgi:hypothetical protein